MSATNQKPTDPNLSLADAAAILGVTPATIRRRISDGTLPYRRVGNAIRLSRSDLDAAFPVQRVGA